MTLVSQAVSTSYVKLLWRHRTSVNKLVASRLTWRMLSVRVVSDWGGVCVREKSVFEWKDDQLYLIVLSLCFCKISCKCKAVTSLPAASKPIPMPYLSI